MTTVLVMTNDLGLQFWLAEALAEAGFFVVPAKSPAKARGLLTRFKYAIDVVILSPTLARATAFVETLRHSQRHLQVLPIPDPGDAISRIEWMRRIRKTLSLSAIA